VGWNDLQTKSTGFAIQILDSVWCENLIMIEKATMDHLLWVRRVHKAPGPEG
jgi:hypothetical protein